MTRAQRWAWTSCGLKLKLFALLVLSLLLCETGVLLLASPGVFQNRTFILTCLAAFVTAVAFDLVGRMLCLASPSRGNVRILLGVSVGCQLAAIGVLATPFLSHGQLSLGEKLLSGILPAAGLQIIAACLFMRFARDTAVQIGRADLAEAPVRVLAKFGIAAGSSLATLVLMLLGLLVLCACPLLGWIMMGAGLLIQERVPAFPPGVVFYLPLLGALAILYVPFRDYGRLLYRLAAAIDMAQAEGTSE